MANTSKQRVPMAEQIRLINECRNSGLSDAEWCRQNEISASTFYNWVTRCRRNAAANIPEASYGHSENPRPRQDVVSIDIVPDSLPEQPAAPAVPAQHLDNSHTIEIEMNGIRISISNSADPVLLSNTLRILKETVC